MGLVDKMKSTPRTVPVRHEEGGRGRENSSTGLYITYVRKNT